MDCILIFRLKHFKNGKCCPVRLFHRHDMFCFTIWLPYVCKPGESFGRYRCEHQLDLSNSYSMKLWVKSIKILRLVCANGLNGQTWKQCQNHNFIPHDFLDLHLYLLIVDYFRPNKSCPSPTCTNCARPIISALRLFLARLVHHLLHSHWCTMCILLLCSVEHHPVLS